MSWQAIEAVQDDSSITDHTALSIFYVIARHADGSGVAGANGRLTSPSIDTIARLARCHRNTVLNWLPKIEATGELTIERLGAGRGSWNRYTINLKMPNNGTAQVVPLTENNGTSNGTKTDLLVQELSEKVDLLVQVMVHNGTSWDGLDTKDTLRNIYIEPDSDQITALKTAVASIAREPIWEKTAERYDQFANILTEWNQTPEQVKGFSRWWADNKPQGYSGKPALTSVINTYQDYMNGIAVSANGSNASRNEDGSYNL